MAQELEKERNLRQEAERKVRELEERLELQSMKTEAERQSNERITVFLAKMMPTTKRKKSIAEGQ